MNYADISTYLISKLDERQGELKDHITKGSLKDMSEYTKLCGLIQGLEFAKELIIDLSIRMEKDDE